MPLPVRAYAAFAADRPLAPWSFERRDPRPDDVVIDIHYCGVCHSDLHIARNHLGDAYYPMTPGHEITGVVAAVGGSVTRFAPGDRVGVGCLVDSDRTCPECRAGEEQFCDSSVLTYGGRDLHDATPTQGGYSTRIVVSEAFVLRIPDALTLDRAAPLLCAGITTWSPLRAWGVGPGSKVGVIGLGGLGHMAVKLASALGAEVTVISTSDRKKDDALGMGAADFLISTNKAAMRAARNRFDLIVNTVSAAHEVNGQLALLARDGTMVMLGLVPEPMQVSVFPLLSRRRRLAGSPIGGIRETQEMLDFCAAHSITPEIETIAPDRINEAWDRMEKSDVRYRFVIDMARMD